MCVGWGNWGGAGEIWGYGAGFAGIHILHYAPRLALV